MAFQRAPRPDAQMIDGPYIQKQNIQNLLSTVSSDKTINLHESIYPYIPLYKQQGVDLEGYYSNHAVTARQDFVKDDFVHNNEHGFAAQLAESLPLLANKEGRLGDYVKAKVTKTAKQDDQGNSFVDLVVEIDNTWIGSSDPLAPKNMPTKMTFLVDVTTSTEGDLIDKKIAALRGNLLLYGERANVKCYKDADGVLGLERPKLLVAKESDYIQKVGSMLGDCVTQLAGDSFSINKPEIFEREYRKFFQDFMDSLGKNAEQNIQYIDSLSHDNVKRARLAVEYKKIVAFVEAYKKTPVTKKRSA
jgi:hypothetical protein